MGGSGTAVQVVRGSREAVVRASWGQGWGGLRMGTRKLGLLGRLWDWAGRLDTVDQAGLPPLTA